MPSAESAHDTALSSCAREPIHTPGAIQPYGVLLVVEPQPLQVRERRSVVLLVGQVQCEPLSLAQLPADIRQQARVTRLLQEQALIAVSPQTAATGGVR